MKTVYYSLFFSKIKYCITSWGGVPKSVIDPIYKLQKRAIRFVSSKPFRTPTQPLFHRLKMLKLQDIYKHEVCKMTHYMKSNKLYGELTLTNLTSHHNYRTRLSQEDNFYTKPCRTNLGQTAFEFIAPKLWREVPSELKPLNTHAFKNKYKNYLINLYDVDGN